jgi:EmrB/QacA subfamily drug resistance transporter
MTAGVKNLILKDETKEARIYRLRWWTLVTIALSVLVVILDTTVMNVALPTIQRQLGATGSELLWMVNAYTMIMGAMVITTGSLGDRLGRGKMLQIGLAFFGISSLGAFLSTTPLQLIICRILMGGGAAMIMPSTLSTISSVFPEKERGQAIGVWAGLNAIGIALGPVIGGLLVEHFRWNSIFMINIPIAAIALILGWFLVPDTRNSTPSKLDLTGNLLSLVGLSALIYGLINGGSRGWTDVQVLGTLGGGAALIALFILWERHTPQPLLKLSFFRNSRFSAGIGILIIVGLAMSGVVYVLTYYMQFVQGYDPLGAGLRFIPFAAGMLLGAVSADRFVNRLGARWVMALGFLGTGVVLFALSFLRIGSSFWQLGTEFVFFGIFLGFIQAPVMDIIMGALPPSDTGIGSAINNSFRQIAGTIGVAILGAILAGIYTSSFLDSAAAIPGLPASLAQKAGDSVGVAIGIANSGQLTPDLANSLAQIARQSFMDGWSIVMIICGGIFIAGTILVLKLIPRRSKPKTPVSK